MWILFIGHLYLMKMCGRKFKIILDNRQLFNCLLRLLLIVHIFTHTLHGDRSLFLHKLSPGTNCQSHWSLFLKCCGFHSLKIRLPVLKQVMALASMTLKLKCLCNIFLLLYRTIGMDLVIIIEWIWFISNLIWKKIEWINSLESYRLLQLFLNLIT